MKSYVQKDRKTTFIQPDNTISIESNANRQLRAFYGKCTYKSPETKNQPSCFPQHATHSMPPTACKRMI